MQVPGRHKPVEHPQLVRLLGLQPVCGVQQFQGPVDPHRPGIQPGCARVGHQSHLQERIHEPRVLTSHPYVAGQYEIEPVTDGQAVYHRNGRHLHLVQLEGNALGTASDELVDLVGFHVAQQPVAPFPFLVDVGGGAERPPRTGQHQRPDFPVAGHVVQRRVYLPEHQAVERI